MNKEKDELRRTLKENRLGLDYSDYVIWSREITSSLERLMDWSGISSLHYYEPIKELFEPDIGEFISYLEDNHPSISLAAPRLINNEWRMVMARGDNVPETFDVILVPALGFDEALNRIGYGGGYYDKFLKDQPEAKKIGICFEAGRSDTINPETHDIPLNVVVTEKRVYT